MAFDLTKLNNTAVNNAAQKPAAAATFAAGAVEEPKFDAVKTADNAETKKYSGLDGLLDIVNDKSNDKYILTSELPAGAYPAILDVVKFDEKSGNSRVTLQYQIIDGEFKGKVASDFNNVRNEKGEWNKFAVKNVTNILTQFTVVFGEEIEAKVANFLFEAVSAFDAQDTDLAIKVEDFNKFIGTLTVKKTPQTDKKKAENIAAGKSTEPYTNVSFKVAK